MSDGVWLGGCCIIFISDQRLLVALGARIYGKRGMKLCGNCEGTETA
jgi:hypothetical protein